MEKVVCVSEKEELLQITGELKVILRELLKIIDRRRKKNE